MRHPRQTELASRPRSGPCGRSRPIRASNRAASGLCLALLLLLAAPLVLAEEVKPARIKVSGCGFWQNRLLRKALRILEPGDKPPTVLDDNYLEDAALVLVTAVMHEGYLRPRLLVEIMLADGSRRTYEWDHRLDRDVPSSIRATAVRFRIERGVRYYYDRVEFTGLESLSWTAARRFLVQADTLVRLKSDRIYTPERLESSLANLREVLLRKGFENASVSVQSLEADDETGAVRIKIAVEEGLPSVVRSVRVQVQPPEAGPAPPVPAIAPHTPFSPVWAQDLALQTRARQYHEGRPDAAVKVTPEHRETGLTNVQVDVLATVKPGPLVRVGDVQIEGLQRTRESFLRGRIKLAPGDPLDPSRAEQGRNWLARLGIFDTVALRYDPVDDATRDVVYELKEGKRNDVSLHLGYGSYEMLRGGIEWERYNFFGLAHRSRLRLLQSMKATHADFLYTMPELIGRRSDLFFNASGLRREEISFVREEYVGSVGVQRHIPALVSDVSLRYTYQFLNADEPEADLPESVQRAKVGSFVADLKYDQQDNPLSPTRGLKLFGTVEIASEALGGDVNFQRLEFAGAWHRPLGGGRFLHLGASHGLAITAGGNPALLPFNKRFFPGGENSVRGYQQGEASPLDDDGNVIGAATYLQGNLEFEQQLTRNWSLVAFVDAVGISPDLDHYPFNEFLYSVGGGIRWKTIVGPVRLEYGYNLNRRSHDPVGTLHFSLGFPF